MTNVLKAAIRWMSRGLEPGSTAEADLARLRDSPRVAGAALWEYDGVTDTMTVIESGRHEVFGRAPGEWNDLERRHALRHPDDTSTGRDAIARLLHGETGQVEYETRVEDGNGGWRRLHHTASRAAEHGGQLIRGFSIDVTAQRLEHDLYKALFDSTVVGVSVIDADRRMIDCNEAFCRILGRARPDVIGRLATAFNYDEEDDVSAGGMARLAAGELDGYTVEKRYRRADGTPVWVRLTTSAISRTHGLYVGIVEDLTERDRAEMRLRERTALLTRAQQIGGVGSWVYTPSENRDEWSPEARRIFGFSDEDADRCDPALFFGALHPDDRDWLMQAAKASFDAGLPTEFEYRIVRPSDGAVRWVREQVEVERGPDGAPYRMLGIVMDVTDRRRAETELRAQAALLARAQEIGKLGSYEIDLRTRRMTVSRELARVLNLSGQVLELDVDEFRRRFIHEDDRAAWAAEAEAAFSAGGVFALDRRVQRPDGSVIWVTAHGEVESDPDGVPLRVVGVMQDVSDRQKAEAGLREQTKLLERAQQVAKIGTWVIDLVEGTLLWSPALAAMLGEREDGIVRSSAEFRARYVHEDDVERWSATMDRAYAEGGDFTIKARLRRANRSVIWVHLHAAVELDEQGNPSRVLGVIQNVTEAHRLEEQLRQAQKLDAVGQLAGGIAHDFNNLLTVIAGNALLALSGGDTADVHEQMREILRASEGASGLVRQLLAFSRSDTAEPRPVDVNAAVTAVCRMLSRLLEENIELESDLDSGDATILADPVELEHIILNLAVNARDAMPDGGRLTLRTRRNAHAVMLTVGDTGRGMDDHTRARIFDPFFTTKPRGQGTGLGLSTVYGIVSKAGGEVTVRSAPGQGSTFTIRWPRARVEAVAEEADEPRPIVPGAGEKILIVEDEPMVRAIAAEIISRAGYAITTAENGAEALDLFEQGAGFDLIVSDLMMPKLTGLQLTQELRTRGHRLPTVYTSGYPQGVAADTSEDDPLVTFIGKPYSGETLTAAIRRQLDRADDAARIA
ncbi:MAG TPA: PAS domain-containing protein [Gaiellaceae bacterium]|nr:PAS domain-containing protein [Gaiellaceae bacterium]